MTQHYGSRWAGVSFTSRLVRAGVFIAVAAVATFGTAATDPVMRRGFNPGSRYDYSGHDNVDMFTGNLSVRIPLGQKFQSNGTLSYQFVLTYNSTIWDFYKQTVPDVAIHTHQRLGRWINLERFDATVAGGEGDEALPARTSNAGLGWRLSLGDIVGGNLNNSLLVIAYLDETGAERTFFSSLHGSLGSDYQALSGAGPFYTRDGSYLRLRRTDDLTSAMDPVRVEIDSPDGLVRRFTCRTCASDGLAAQWTLDEIADPFGNLLVITRDTENQERPNAGFFWNWTFAEKTKGADGYVTASASGLTDVRTHTARFFVRSEYTVTDGSGGEHKIPGELQLHSLTLAACCDADAEAPYTLQYEDMDVYRPPQMNWYATHMIIPEPVNGDGKSSLGILRSVALPAQGGSYVFRYLGEDPAEDAAALQVIDRGSTMPPASEYAGRLKRLLYPTAGGMRYEYATRAFIKVTCDPAYGSPGPRKGDRIQRMVGVSLRQPIGAGGGDLGNAWHYTANDYRLARPAEDGRCTDSAGVRTGQAFELTAAVIDPSGRADVSYFSIHVGYDGLGTYAPWTHTEYGMPISHYDDAEDTGGRSLTSEVYDCSGLTITPGGATDLIRRSVRRYQVDGESGCVGPLRKTYVKLENSGLACDPATQVFGGCSHSNRRIASSRTMFRDYCTYKDAPPYCSIFGTGETARNIVTDFSNYDGLGHYRTAKVSGDFYAQAWGSESDRVKRDQRSSTSWYNPGVAYDQNSKTITPAVVLSDGSRPWFLGAYSYTKTTAWDSADKTAYAHYRFRCIGTHTPCASDGYLEGSRHLLTLGGADAHGNNDTAMGTVNADDVLVRNTRAYDPADKSLSVTTNYYGGSVYAGSSGIGLDAGDLQSANLPVAAPEYSIRQTFRHGSVARTEYLCEDRSQTFLLVADGAVNAATGLITASRDAWGVTNNQWTSFGYDALGRTTSIDPPNQAPNTYTYPPLSGSAPWTMTATQAGGAAGDVTQTYTYDSLGRPVETSRILKSATGTVQREYGDDHSLQSVSNASDASFKYNAYTRDVFGRVVKVNYPEAAGEEIRDVTTSYYGAQRLVRDTMGVATQLGGTSTSRQTHYSDVFGRLVKVEEPVGGAITRYGYDYADRLTTVRGTTGGGQNRTFLYDGRGFLVRENPPELLLDVLYENIDSRGNVHKRKYGDAGTPLFDLTFSFDRAERLTAVSANNGKPLKTFGYKDGKLVADGRVNVVPKLLAEKLGEDEFSVETSYAYYPSGDLQSKTIRSGFNGSVAYDYNDLGAVKSISYPATPAGPARKVEYGYSRGELNTVRFGPPSSPSDLINSIDYHPNGVWSRIVRSNLTADFQSISEDDTARPSALTSGRCTNSTCAGLAGGGVYFQSGTMLYDGFGNVKTLQLGPGSADRYAYDGMGRLTNAAVGDSQQVFAYDPYGNMTGRSTTRDGVSTTTSFEILVAGGTVTNRLSKIGGLTVDYDHAGNVKKWTDPVTPEFALDSTYDQFNMLKASKLLNGVKREFGRVYLYDAGDERVATIDYAFKAPNAPARRDTWYLRGADNEILREVVHELRPVDGKNQWGPWTHVRDYIYADMALVAEADTSSEHPVRHIHRDHLGSVRAITGTNGTILEQRKYLPFGELVSNSATAKSRMSFAGHERENDVAGETAIGELDYMGARYYSSAQGRFLSIDPGRDWHIQDPQTWNMYLYGRNRPTSLTDPTGRSAAAVITVGAVAVTALAAWAVAPSPVDMERTNVQVAGKQLNDAAQASRPSAKKARELWQDWVEGWLGVRPDVPKNEKGDRYWDMHHKDAGADSGKWVQPDNLIPLPHAEHVDLHQLRNDPARWGKKGGKAKPQPKPGKKKGAEVQPPAEVCDDNGCVTWVYTTDPAKDKKADGPRSQ